MLATRYDALRVREVDAASRPDDKELDIEVLQMRSASQHHAFLEGWRGSIPPELVAVYLGIVGRHNRSLESYRAEWTKDATMNIDHELDALAHDKRMPALFLIEEIRGPSIEAIALSGDRFCAPLGDHTSLRLVVGNRHKQQKYLSPFRSGGTQENEDSRHAGSDNGPWSIVGWRSCVGLPRVHRNRCG